MDEHYMPYVTTMEKIQGETVRRHPFTNMV